jgi:predicted AlkP superfamily phosphohydrolase/phosphomutase
MMSKKTVLIGLDGATFTVLDPLMRDGVMPFLAGLVDGGARAELRSTIPALTPPAWTSVMTGYGPGRHGIFDFFRRESAASPTMQFLTSRAIGTETIWERASAYGRRVTVLNFPLTFPPPTVDGHVVPGGWMPWRQLRLGCYPEGLYDRLKALPGFNPRRLAMDMSHEEKALEGCRREEYEGWVTLHISREQQWGAVVEHLMVEDPVDLTAVMFDGVDKIQHLCWRFVDPDLRDSLSEPWELRVREVCLEYFRVVDDLIARITALAGEDATVVIVSDHGFGPQVRTFFVNAWLAQRGELAWNAGEGPRASGTAVVGVGQLARHVYQLDWSRTRAYAPMPSGNGIHIVRGDAEHPYGVPAREYERYRDQLASDLLALRDADGVQVVRRVWRREEIFKGPYLELSPDLTLELQDGGLVSILDSEQAVMPRPEPSGTHRPEGVFIGSGPGWRKGASLPQLSLLDVAPLLLYSLDVPVPADFEGRVPFEALEAGARPVRPEPVSASAPRVDPVAESVLDAEAEAEIMRRLQALGYVE